MRSPVRVVGWGRGRDRRGLVLFLLPPQTGLGGRLLIYGRLLRVLRHRAVLHIDAFGSVWRTAARHGRGAEWGEWQRDVKTDLRLAVPSGAAQRPFPRGSGTSTTWLSGVERTPHSRERDATKCTLDSPDVLREWFLRAKLPLDLHSSVNPATEQSGRAIISSDLPRGKVRTDPL
jgi:hypothetical protein